MQYRLRFVTLCLAALIMFCTQTLYRPATASGISTVQSEDLATGGPFTSKSHGRTHHFYGQFRLNASDLDKPLVLHLHNGLGGNSGFSWLRVLLGADLDLKDIEHQKEPTADLLFDENYIERHTIDIDLTDKVFEGVNTLIFEGTGPKGAEFGWVLEGQSSPKLAPINPTSVIAGGRLTLRGNGFSIDPDENVVIVGGHEAEIVSSSRHQLTVKVPRHVAPGKQDLKIITNGVESAPYSISVEARLDGTGSSATSSTTNPTQSGQGEQ